MVDGQKFLKSVKYMYHLPVKRKKEKERMNKKMSKFREIEKICREVAEKAAICSELEEKEDATPEEMEEAGKNLMWAIMKFQNIQE